MLLESLLHVDVEAALLPPVLSFVRIKALIFVQILRKMEVGTSKDHIAVVVVIRFLTSLDFHLRMKGRRYTYGTLTGANAEYPLDLLALHFPVHGTTLDVTGQRRPSPLLRTASSTRTWDAGACLPPMLRPDRSCRRFLWRKRKAKTGRNRPLFWSFHLIQNSPVYQYWYIDSTLFCCFVYIKAILSILYNNGYC